MRGDTMLGSGTYRQDSTDSNNSEDAGYHTHVI
jgi:hypothetical protein